MRHHQDPDWQPHAPPPPQHLEHRPSLALNRPRNTHLTQRRTRPSFLPFGVALAIAHCHSGCPESLPVPAGSLTSAVLWRLCSTVLDQHLLPSRSQTAPTPRPQWRPAVSIARAQGLPLGPVPAPQPHFDGPEYPSTSFLSRGTRRTCDLEMCDQALGTSAQCPMSP